MPIPFLFLIYYSFIAGVFFIIHKKAKYIDNLKKFDFYFLFLGIVVFIIFCLINFYVDGNQLNTDRWSALHVSVESILNGKYPYSQLDHLGQTSSNLPGLFYIGLPFYLLGNVSLLQPFVFLMLVLFLYYLKIDKHYKLVIMFILLSSPAYIFEIVGKSDLLSNIFLVLLFISIWAKRFKNNLFQKSILLAFFCAFFSLTRGIVIIPLTLFLFSEFYTINLKNKIKFILWFVIFIGVVSLPVLINLPDYEVLKEHNPFNHQTAFAPKFLMILSILAPFLLSFKIKNTSDTFRFSFYILSILLVTTFCLNWIDEGFYNNLYGSLFDITYLSMTLPFIIFYFFEKFKTS